MGAPARGRFGFLGRLGPAAPPAADADADAALLDRYARAADADAFAALVRRHGPMVFAVCRRRLGHAADAEDAFQAVFLALATSATRLRRREAVAGWLYRAAYLIALKATGRRARAAAHPLPDEVPMPAPPPAWEAAELRAAVDAEVADLPEKLRAVVALCLLEGRTSAEAAAVLGIPAGTVDSRLHVARKTLQARLTRRGVAVGLAVTLEQLVGGPVGAAGPRLLSLMSSTAPAVLAEAARPGAGAVSPAIADLARGVTAMTTHVRAVAALGLAVGLLGTAGAGVYLGAQPDAPAAAKKAAKEPEPKQDPEPKAAPSDEKGEPEPPPPIRPAAGKGTAAALDAPFGVQLGEPATALRELLDRVEDQTGLIVRVDVAAFRRLEGVLAGDGGFVVEQFLQQIHDTRAVLPRRADRLPTRDVLGDALAQVRMQFPCTFQVRGNQLVIVPAYIPPTPPGIDLLARGQDDDVNVESWLDTHMRAEQIYGGVVAVTADRKPLADVLADLRRQTGANIVLDPRAAAVAAKATLTVTLSDVRLYDALRVLADMAELRLVYAGNIYYVTTPENARTFQRPAAAPPALRPAPPGM